MPKPIPFYVVDAFTRKPFAGNPAGVFVDSDARLADEQMRRMAGEVHLESAFVSPPSPQAEGLADLRLRYFTGVMEVPLCGHATIAALTALFQKGWQFFEVDTPTRTLRVETNVGILTALVARDPSRTRGLPVWVTLHQNAPAFGEPLDAALSMEAFRSIGVSKGEAALLPPVQMVSTGTPWLFAHVRKRALVDAAPADLAFIAELSKQTGTFGIYVFCKDAKRSLQTWGRCFAPIVGLNEDPVTGSASGALGCYLAQQEILSIANDEARVFKAQQGFAGGRGGTVQVNVSRDATGALGVSVTGEAVLVAEGSFRV